MPKTREDDMCRIRKLAVFISHTTDGKLSDRVSLCAHDLTTVIFTIDGNKKLPMGMLPDSVIPAVERALSKKLKEASDSFCDMISGTK